MRHDATAPLVQCILSHGENTKTLAENRNLILYKVGNMKAATLEMSTSLNDG